MSSGAIWIAGIYISALRALNVKIVVMNIYWRFLVNKGYPFEVIIPSGLEVTGAILSDQVKNLDWKMRNTEFYDKVPETVILKIFKKLSTLLRFDR